MASNDYYKQQEQQQAPAGYPDQAPQYVGPPQQTYQGQGAPQYANEQDRGFGGQHHGQQGYNGPGQPPTQVVVVKEHHTEDAALGCCAGCMAACCCCGCTVM